MSLQDHATSHFTPEKEGFDSPRHRRGRQAVREKDPLVVDELQCTDENCSARFWPTGKNFGITGMFQTSSTRSRRRLSREGHSHRGRVWMHQRTAELVSGQAARSPALLGCFRTTRTTSEHTVRAAGAPRRSIGQRQMTAYTGRVSKWFTIWSGVHVVVQDPDKETSPPDVERVFEGCEIERCETSYSRTTANI